MQRLHDQCVVMLAQDSFYRGLTQEELKDVGGESVPPAVNPGIGVSDVNCIPVHAVPWGLSWSKMADADDSQLSSVHLHLDWAMLGRDPQRAGVCMHCVLVCLIASNKGS